MGRATGLALSICLLVAMTPSSALAANCPLSNEQLFQRAAFSQADPTPIYSQGAQGRILFQNNDLDSNCDNALAVKTVHISSSGSWTSPGWCKQVEIGSRLKWDSSGASSDQSLINKTNYLFTEWQYTCDPGIKDLTIVQVGNYLQAGTDDIWRISGDRQSNGDEEWTLSVNYLDGAGYQDFNVYTTTSWNSGTPSGETERFAASNPGTGMGDSHSAMKYKAGSWLDWAWNVCEQHAGSGLAYRWKTDRTASDAFDVVVDTTPPPC